MSCLALDWVKQRRAGVRPWLRGMLAVLGCAVTWQVAAAEPPVQTYTAVDIRFTDDSAMPGADARWEPYVLPYQASLDEPLAYHYAWFRLTLPGSQATAGQSLYLNNHMFTVDVYFNGYRIGGSNVPPGKLAIGWNRPLLLPLPAGLWQMQGNTLLFRLELARYTNFLAPVLIGEHSRLYPLWQSKGFWQNQIPLVAFVMCILMGGFTLILWWQRQQDVAYGLFAGTALCWSWPMLYLAVPYDLLPHSLFLILVYWAILGTSCFFLPFNLRTLGLKFPVLEHIFVGLMLALCLVLPMVPAVSIIKVVSLAQVSALAVFAVLIGYAGQRAWRYREPAARWVALSGVVILLLLVRDVYEFSSSARSNTMISSGTYMQYSFPIALTGFFIQLLRRFSRALNRSEQLNLNLKERVDAVSDKLKLSYEDNRELELRRAAEQQKRLIFRDLHDDVGARLVSIMHARKSEEQARLARSALESLRETVSGSTMHAMTLPVWLETICAELEVRCRLSELDFKQLLPGTVPEVLVPANTCYQLLRILQEVLTNTIKHAGASEVSFNAAVKGGQLWLSLEDNGCGLDDGHASGNGLRNIRHRVGELGAQARWEAGDPQGCRFLVYLNLPSPEVAGDSNGSV